MLMKLTTGSWYHVPWIIISESDNRTWRRRKEIFIWEFNSTWLVYFKRGASQSGVNFFNINYTCNFFYWFPLAIKYIKEQNTKTKNVYKHFYIEKAVCTILLKSTAGRNQNGLNSVVRCSHWFSRRVFTAFRLRGIHCNCDPAWWLSTDPAKCIWHKTWL